jgi:hypothetical protein
MAKFIGKGLLEPYSNEIVLTEPVTTYSLKFLLRLPEDLSENIIAVRGSRKLNDGDLVYDDDDIILFLATLGG